MRDSAKLERRDRGIAQVLLLRLNNERLPYAEKLKKKVDRGELLSDYDLRFIEQADVAASEAHRIAAKQPQYQELVQKLTSLYSEILRKHQENLQHPPPQT